MSKKRHNHSATLKAGETKEGEETRINNTADWIIVLNRYDMSYLRAKR